MNFIKKQYILIPWLFTFLLAVSIYLYFDLSLKEISEKLKNFINDLGMWGPFAYVSFYSLRSLLLFPASVLTVIAGMLFGPYLGMLLTVIGENISANVSFIIGRYFGSDFLRRFSSKIKIINQIECRFQKNGFVAVLTMRLMFVPFDLVGYSSGVCNIRQQDFALGTFLGTIPGLATFVLLGSSVTNLKNLYFSVISFCFGLILSIFLKNRKNFQPIIS